jgi:galacturan 1,4-alpha-galacturonidase
VTNSTIEDITSKDSKLFHMNIINCKNVTFKKVTIDAPGESLNTDGIHIGRSSGITITGANIKTGDDCVSLGDGCEQITVEGVTCGPGHGISIGSLGRYQNEQPVVGVTVHNCTFNNTMNGVRVKTWPGSPSGVASDLHFESLIMNNVSTPVLIDQEYCPYNQCQQEVHNSFLTRIDSTQLELAQRKSLYIYIYILANSLSTHSLLCLGSFEG